MERQEQISGLCDYGAPYSYSYSSRFAETKDLSTKELAKIIRQEIRGLKLKGFKISVTSPRNSIEVRLVGVPEGFKVYTDEFVSKYNDAGDWSRGVQRYTAETEQLLEVLKDIRGQFNYNRSDIQTDYFDVRYYGSVGVGWYLERELLS